MNAEVDFKMEHGSASLEKTLAAADRVEQAFGKFASGDKRALGRLSLEDMALLVQFPRDAANKQA